MAIDYSLLKFPKGRAKVMDRRQKSAVLKRRDQEERDKCHARSGGRCEIVLGGKRCRRRQTENHHIKSGIGRRNRDDSLLAAWRVDVCTQHHQDIHAGLLDVRGPVSRLKCEVLG